MQFLAYSLTRRALPAGLCLIPKLLRDIRIWAADGDKPIRRPSAGEYALIFNAPRAIYPQSVSPERA